MNHKEITSPTNPTIKELVRLKDRKSERSEKEFLVEGFREIDRAIQSGFDILEHFGVKFKKVSKPLFPFEIPNHT